MNETGAYSTIHDDVNAYVFGIYSYLDRGSGSGLEEKTNRLLKKTHLHH
jgi:hypothetical protein